MQKPQKTSPIGLALVRATEILSAEPYYHELIAGIERVVRPAGYSVLVKVLPTKEAELKTYQQWGTDGDVSAVLLVDLAVDDPRLALVESLSLPAIVIGPPAAGSNRTVWTDDGNSMRMAVEFLATLGHTRIAHVMGPSGFRHTQIRETSFVEACNELAIDNISISGDYSQSSGERATLELIASDDRPTAVIADSDVMALGVLAAARARGIAVPNELSVLAWDDSTQCQLSDPPLSAVSHDVQLIGMLAGEEVLKELSHAVHDSPTESVVAATSIVARSSTAPPPSAP